MKHVIDTDKVEEIDFLTGNEPYKKDWMSASRKRWGMICTKKREPESKDNLWLRLLKSFGLH